MPTIDAQVHAYERNRPGRPWIGTLYGPAEVTGDQMVAAMDAVGVDGAILVSPFSMYRYDASYALEVYAAHPDRFRLVKPVDPADPGVADTREGKMPKIALQLFAASLMLLAGLSGGAAGAAEIKVLSAGAMRAVLEQIAPAFEKSSGHKLVTEYATAGKVEEKVAADDAIDVAILTKPRADKLVRTAKLVGGTIKELARVPIGLAVKKGAPRPDISSVEAVKRTLLNAKSIAYVDPVSGGTSGIFLAQALEKLGIAAELKPKLHLVSPAAGQSSPRVGEVVQRGEAEIGMQPISELMEVEGIEIVGPLPAELQSPDLVYMAGSPAVSEQPIAAKALIDFLAAPAAAPVYKAKGMQPG